MNPPSIRPHTVASVNQHRFSSPFRKPAAIAILLATLSLAACDNTPATPSGPAGGKPRATGWAQPLAIGPISYFNAQCSSCHGNYGKEIADHNIARTSPPGEYRGMVEYMVVERSASSLPPRELDAQTAYCISLAAPSEGVVTEGSPIFVAVKNPINEGGLEGEVTPGCTVALITAKGQVRIEAKVDGHTWSIEPMQVKNAKSSAGDDWVNATIEARAKGVATPQVLQLSDEAFKGPVFKTVVPPPTPGKVP